MQGKTALHNVRPYAGAIGADFILMDDNARPHRANAINQYLEDVTIVRMDWPVHSPDMNPIELAWDMLQRVISARLAQPSTFPQLRTALQKGWARLPQ